MTQEKEEAGTGSHLFEEEQIYRMSFSLDQERYSGERKAGADSFVVASEAGKKLFVLVRENAAEEKADLSYEQYPHLHGPRRVIREEKRTFILNDLLEKPFYEPIEEVLFGKGISLTQRILLSLSLAAAWAELEEIYEKLPVMQFRLDAVLVEKKTFSVQIDCAKLERESLPDETEQEYEKMARLGLMPPEWYENPVTDLLGLPQLRHILAVLLFRTLCASDPFDGARTLEEYPYKSRQTLRKIYGKDADYVLYPEGKNRANSYIGGTAKVIFSRICPELKKLFEKTFLEGVKDPKQRPAAPRWLENQKQMMNWYQNAGQDWRIPDLKTGYGTLKNLNYLCLENGVVLPVLPDKQICRYMLEPSECPFNENIVGSFKNGGYGLELSFNKEEQQMAVPLDLYGGLMKIWGLEAQIKREPWKE